MSLGYLIGRKVVTKKSFSTLSGIIEIKEGTMCEVIACGNEFLTLRTFYPGSNHLPEIRFRITGVKLSDVNIIR